MTLESIFSFLQQVSSAFQFLSMFFVGIIVAFIYSWKLTLVSEYSKRVHPAHNAAIDR